MLAMTLAEEDKQLSERDKQWMAYKETLGNEQLSE